MTLPRSLIRAVAEGQLVPFVGSGVSVSVKRGLFPTWPELLLILADELEKEADPAAAEVVRRLCEKGELYSAAGTARSALGPASFNEIMTKRFHLREQPRDVNLSLPKAIWKLRPSLVLTTNYEDVLRWANPRAAIVLNHYSAELARWSSTPSSEPNVWHLHGHASMADSLILAPTQYKKFYASNESQRKDYHAALQVLESLVVAKRLLFIGFSLKDDFVMNLLSEVLERFSGNLGHNFALLKQGTPRPELWSKYAIRVIEFADYGEPQLKILEELAAVTEGAGPATERPEPSRAAEPDVAYGEIPPEVTEYLKTEIRHLGRITLPLISHDGQSVVVPISRIRADLPLIVIHAHAPMAEDKELLFLGSDLLETYERIRRSYTNAYLADRAAHFDDAKRDVSIGERLESAKRLVLVGDPGSGKSTLLQWMAHDYACALADAHHERPERGDPGWLPPERWLPITILCRDLPTGKLPEHINDIVRSQLKKRQFSQSSIDLLVGHFEQQMGLGRAILLIDGLDEIPDPERRQEFSSLLVSLASHCDKIPIIVTSRVIGFQAVRHVLAGSFDHLLIGPLDRAAKASFVSGWAGLRELDPQDEADLRAEVCSTRKLAKLTENILMLSMIAQMHSSEHPELPDRRSGVYRRVVEHMIESQRSGEGERLTTNEVVPHLECLAYEMRRSGSQRLNESAVLDAFAKLRQRVTDLPHLNRRSTKDLLKALIESMGALNESGRDRDASGSESRVIQFFHQSFQEYFAGQAIKHARYSSDQTGVVARIRDTLSITEVRVREVEILGRRKVKEPILADYWQESVRLLIADLDAQDADDAIQMILPTRATPARESRARSVFAMQCLADEPKVSEDIVARVFEAMMGNLTDDDCNSSRRDTSMDEAIGALSQSPLGSTLREKLIDAYIEGSGNHRGRISNAILLMFQKCELTEENAESVIPRLVASMSSNGLRERVEACLELAEHSYQAHGRLTFLPEGGQKQIIETLMRATSRDMATSEAALRALYWFTGAPDSGKDSHVQLPASDARRLEKVVREPGQAPNIVRFASMILTREEELVPVFDQNDWIYALAVIADGGKPRRDLLVPTVVTEFGVVDSLVLHLKAGVPVDSDSLVALALGRFGIYVSEMVEPLAHMFRSKKCTDDRRDEAMLYLALVDTPNAQDVLVWAAETDESDEYYLHSRGLFGLLMADDVDTLSGQLQRPGVQDASVYAYALAGSSNPRGRDILEGLSHHENTDIRGAVDKAMAASWYESNSSA